MSVLRLIRWPNLIIIAVTMVVIRQCIMKPVLAIAEMEIQLSPLLFTLLVLSTVFIAAGGYAINDYFDTRIDRVNKPGSMVVGKQIYPRHAMAWHLILTVTGVLMGSFVSLQTRQFYLSLVFFMVSGLLWFYSTTYKRELLLGNFIVALLTAMVPLTVPLFEVPLLARAYGSPVNGISKYMVFWIAGFSLFAFLLNLTREIVKDAQDMKGDKIYGKRTIAVVWGTAAVRYISVIIILFTIALLILAWINFISGLITLIYFGIMIVLPLILSIFRLIADDSERAFLKVNRLLKVVMVAGMGYSVILSFIFKDIIK